MAVALEQAEALGLFVLVVPVRVLVLLTVALTLPVPATGPPDPLTPTPFMPAVGLTVTLGVPEAEGESVGLTEALGSAW